MRLAYLDTSAAMKMVIEEQHSASLERYLSDNPSLILTASWLLFTELHCAGGRRPLQVDLERVHQALDQVELVELKQRDFIAATRLAPLRSADALHLTVAMRLQADEILTYDRELAEAAERAGIRALAPA
ncbi:MAG: type II toxin-antitoxin system VapC family toxin [Leucobacter sp.]